MELSLYCFPSDVIHTSGFLGQDMYWCHETGYGVPGLCCARALLICPDDKA